MSDTELAAHHSAAPDQDNNEDGPADSEGSGDVVMGDGAPAEDSSEEEEEDEEEAARIRSGFIVDDEEEEEEGADEDVRRHERRRKRHKHKHKRPRHEREEDEDADGQLEDDDLELLAENTGQRFERSEKLSRIRRGRRSESPADHPEPRRGEKGMQDIWEDDVRGSEDDDDDDMRGFIESSDEEDPAITPEERRAAREEKRRQRREARRKGLINPGVAGIDLTEWEEIVEVFGDGGDYEWALDLDEDGNEVKHQPRKENLRLQDVFEPSEIKARLLTEDDDLIRSQDIPERMQMLTSSLSPNPTVITQEAFRHTDINAAAEWVVQRLGEHVERKFFHFGAPLAKYNTKLVAAVQYALDALLCQTLEVPYIWTHRRDQLSVFDPPGRTELLLTNEDLWRIFTLGTKFRALLERKRMLDALYERLSVGDSYFENHIHGALTSVEMVADATDWLGMKYKDRKMDALVFHDDVIADKKHKAPSRLSEYELVKKSVISQLAKAFGVTAEQAVINFKSGSRLDSAVDQDIPPQEFAVQFADPAAGPNLDPRQPLAKARMLLSTELGKDPLLREEARSMFRNSAVVTVLPTDKGLTKIDEFHPYHNFKYLKDKPLSMMLAAPQYLHILKAESDMLITVDIHLPQDVQKEWTDSLCEAMVSEDFSDIAQAWNEERRLVAKQVMDTILVPLGAKWVKEWAREELEDFLAGQAAAALQYRVNMCGLMAVTKPRGGPVANLAVFSPDPDTTPPILAMSWGEGHPQRDQISVVFVDQGGRPRDQLTLPNLSDEAPRTSFVELLRRRRPAAIVIGGFTIHTMKLHERVRDILKKESGIPEESSDMPGSMAPPTVWEAVGGGAWGTAVAERADYDHGGEDSDRWLAKIPVNYVKDDVARIYQSSQRAAEEFSALSSLARYCVGLARYAQSPLLEHCALGSDLSAITFDEDAQQLVPKEKLLIALERTLVNAVNSIGVDINRAVNDPYYFHLLPFVSGLGPRKAQFMKKKIDGIGGTLVNREQIVKNSISTIQIWLNAAGFLRIVQDESDGRDAKRNKRRDESADQQDPLDATRIHPEDYELARKMAMDALEYDEEDTKDEHPSHVIAAIIADKDKETKLNELSLEDFAVNLLQTTQDNKRYTLDVIKSELLHPFYDPRPEFKLPTQWDIITMLTGETLRSLKKGLIVSVAVYRIKDSCICVRLASGLDGVINSDYITDFHDDANAAKWLTKGQTIPAIILDVKLDRNVTVELSCRPHDVTLGDAQWRRVAPDPLSDVARARYDADILLRKKRQETGDNRRVIKHPNFRNDNARQAEDYLAPRSRGEVVIRPSSKGKNHLAVTWKVDESLYQHIDVTEVDGDGGQTVAGRLVVEGGSEYSDLDELIVNHVKAIARRVDELMAHEKFKAGSQEDIERQLRDYVNAYPTRSIYAFTLNRQRPGHFNIVFLANKNSNIVSWPVKVAPSYYALFDTSVPSVSQLTDAFKTRHLYETTKAAAGGKTPYGAGIMTPGGSRTPGHVTPGRASIRQPASRTPNPYAASQIPPPAAPGVFASGQNNSWGPR
ncbi:SH2 domain-containing protein [Auriculariales sp. MPI-PUGE-AT-0066]|nr:SH2 domain-containing protein [Auriculariales sp. MPI-PUGE-AT-0066]